MKVISLQSGSNGNCIYVESGDVRLLFDAGLSGVQVAERLARHGRDVCRVDAVIVSHDHSDHTRCLGVMQRKFGLPVYVTPETLAAAERRCRLGKLGEVQFFRSGGSLRVGHVTIETIPTPHDGVDGVSFVVDDGRSRLGILTDLGHVFADLTSTIASLDAVLLESNYDVEMLRRGPYPARLQARIYGPGGHLSNVEAAELLATAAGERLQWVCLGHISHENNTPALAAETHRRVLGGRLPLHVATRYEATEVLVVESHGRRQRVSAA